MSEYVKIGKSYNAKPPVFELDIYEHVPPIDPSNYGLDQHVYKCIDPAKYFITSGDAVEKAKVLCRDLNNLSSELLNRTLELIAKEYGCMIDQAQEHFDNGTRPSKQKMFNKYQSKVHKAAQSAQKLLNDLILARGEDCFLETEWDDHVLLCIPKNPRSQRID